jgi:hypothetical protein
VYDVDIQNVTKQRWRFLKLEEIWQARLRGRHQQKNLPRTYSDENRLENERYSEKSAASKRIQGGQGWIHRCGKCYQNTIKGRDGNWKMPKVTGNTKRKKTQLETHKPRNSVFRTWWNKREWGGMRRWSLLKARKCGESSSTALSHKQKATHCGS